MYKHLFGPVPSRRLGMSLGIDLVPHKVCSLNCIYCEVGRTTKLTTERREYVLYDKVERELEHYFETNPNPDYITFSGSGEPTLNTRIGDILDFIKKAKPQIPVAVLTNGTLFNDSKLRKELRKADVVLPSLDAASESVFKKINKPHHQLNIADYVNGLETFRNEYAGQIWLEVLILPGYNNSNQELRLLKQAFTRIRPDKIQLNTLDRPGVLKDLQPISYTGLREIADFWQLENVEIIAVAPDRKDLKSYRLDTETAILETIQRRPCTVADLSKILGLHISEINKYLDVLDAEEKVRLKFHTGVAYYQNNESRFDNKNSSA